MKKALLCILLSISTSAFAFKANTHVWVGQQVINDIEDDGKLTFDIGGTQVDIDVADDVKNAILSNKTSFLMGHIGPDALPDLVIGQTLIHPGVRDSDGNRTGWQTNDWLQYLLDNSTDDDVGTAFTYGYLGHAASDVFSHTYINLYAGGTFDLHDETLVEQRHIILEGYIANKTPGLMDYQSNPLGNLWEEVTVNDELAEKVRDKLIYNDDVQNEYWKVSTGNHLAAYYEYRKGIDALAENPIWHEIDIEVTKIAAAMNGIELSNDEAEMIVNAAQPVLDKLNGDVPDAVQEVSDELYERVRKFDDKVFYTLASAVQNMHEVEVKFVEEHQKWRRKISEIVACPHIWVPDGVKCHWLKGCYPTHKKVEDPVCVKANDLIMDVADEIEDRVLGYKEDLIQATIDVREEGVKAADAAHNIQNGLIDLAQVTMVDVSPIQGLLRGWRSDVDIAMTEYVKSAGQVTINTMNPNASSIDPMVEWFECYHLSIIGLPSSVTNCEFRDSVSQIITSTENIIMIIEEVTSVGAILGIPSTRDLIELRDNLVDELVADLREEVTDTVIGILPQNVQDILFLLDENITESDLQHYFTKPESEASLGLVLIPDIAERIKAEMDISATGKFDPSSYAPAYNSVVMAKMALLDRYGFEQLAIAAGSSDYIEYLDSIDNFVAQSILDIDGHHQWMQIPPPLPNSCELYPTVDYTFSTDFGLVIWNDDMRDKIFRKIFIGPIAPGIEAPGSIGKSDIIGSSYPYDSCVAYPFPDDIHDKTCTAIILIPIISSLL